MSRDFPLSLPYWLKASALFSVGPAVMSAALAYTGRVTTDEAVVLSGVFFAFSALCTFPFLHDLRALRNYIMALAEDRPLRQQPLLILRDVENLPEAARALHHNWIAKTRNLQLALRKNSAIFYSLPTPVFLLSASHVILDTNYSAGALFRSYLPGKRLEDVILDPRLHKAFNSLKGLEATTAQIEVHAGGKMQHFHCVLHPLSPQESGENGHRSVSYSTEAVICMLYDISGIIQTQEAMRDFVANASHEIQTPLTGIIGFLEAMLEDDFPRDSSYYEQFLGISLKRAQALSKLTRDLLSLAKIEMSSQGINAEEVDIAGLAVSVADQYRFHSRLLEKKMHLEVDVSKDIPTFPGNSTELQLMISNLLSNALKYGKENGEISISVKLFDSQDDLVSQLVQRRLQERGEKEVRCAARYIGLSVHNEGTPIPPEKIPRLTERFYRADPGRGGDVGGTGIGLSIVSRIIEHHEGLLDISSNESEGTRFGAFFPVADLSSEMSAPSTV